MGWAVVGSRVGSGWVWGGWWLGLGWVVVGSGVGSDWVRGG